MNCKYCNTKMDILLKIVYSNDKKRGGAYRCPCCLSNAVINEIQTRFFEGLKNE